MKDGLEQLPGKTIRAIVVNPLYGQVFLVFSDETHFEFYPGTSNELKWTRAISPGGLDRVRECVQRSSGAESMVVFE